LEKGNFIGSSIDDFIDSSDYKLLNENLQKLLAGIEDNLSDIHGIEVLKNLQANHIS